MYGVDEVLSVVLYKALQGVGVEDWENNFLWNNSEPRTGLTRILRNSGSFSSDPILGRYGGVFTLSGKAQACRLLIMRKEHIYLSPPFFLPFSPVPCSTVSNAPTTKTWSCKQAKLPRCVFYLLDLYRYTRVLYIGIRTPYSHIGGRRKHFAKKIKKEIKCVFLYSARFHVGNYLFS